jgi:hypothetical protein
MAKLYRDQFKSRAEYKAALAAQKKDIPKVEPIKIDTESVKPAVTPPKKTDYGSSKDYAKGVQEWKSQQATPEVPEVAPDQPQSQGTGVFQEKPGGGWQIKDPSTGKLYSPDSPKGKELAGDQGLPVKDTPYQGQAGFAYDDQGNVVGLGSGTEDNPWYPYKNYDDYVKATASGDTAGTATQFEDLGFGDAPFSTLEEYFQGYLQDKQAGELSYLEKQNELAGKLESEQASQAGESLESSVASVTAALSPGREGVVSEGVMDPETGEIKGGAKGVISVFKKNVDRKLGIIKLQRQKAEGQRNQAIKSLKRAQEMEDWDSAAKYKAAIAQADGQIQQAAIDQIDAETAFAEQSMKMAETVNTVTETTVANMEAMGASIVNLTEADLSNMIQNTNLSMPEALALQSAIKLEAEALATKDEAERDYKLAQAEKLREDIKYIGKPSQVQEWEFYSALSDTDQEKFKELKRANPNFQYQEMDDGRWLQTDPTGKTPPKVVYTPEGEGGGFQGAWGTVNDALSVPDGTPIDPTTGEPAIDSWNGKTGSIQCAQFVNRYTGLTMGDDYDSKINAIQSISVDSPQAGDIFVSPYGDNVGHAGFVVSVSDDGGTVTVKDANYVESGKIGTHDMSTDGMKFGRPSGGTNPEEAYPDFWEGLTPKEQGAFSALSSDDQSNIKQLLNGDVLLADLMASRGMEGSKARQKILQQAQSVDPDFSENTNKIRYEFRKKWDSTESSVGKNKLSINTALGHLADVKKMTQNLTPDDIQELNKLSNWWSAESGNTEIVNLQFGLEQLATEIAAVWKGTGAAPSESEIENQKRLLGLQFSEQQFEGILNTASEFLSSKITAARYSYKSTMGKEYAQTIIDPEKKQALIDAGIDPDSIIKENVPMTPEEKQQQADLDLYNKSVEDSKYVPDSIDSIKW